MSAREPNRDCPHVLAPPPLIFAAGFALGLGLQWVLPVHVFWGWAYRVAGWLAAMASGILALWGAVTMWRARTHIDPGRPARAIVTTGPFRFSRNPLYLSLVLLSAGAAVFFDIPWALATLLPTIAVAHWGVIRREECYLESKFGEAYLAYKRRTRRWL